MFNDDWCRLSSDIKYALRDGFRRHDIIPRFTRIGSGSKKVLWERHV
jgi:hypothetical protein